MKQRSLDRENTKRFGARIDADLHEKLRVEAFKRNWSLNYLVEKILSDWVKEHLSGKNS